MQGTRIAATNHIRAGTIMPSHTCVHSDRRWLIEMLRRNKTRIDTT